MNKRWLLILFVFAFSWSASTVFAKSRIAFLEQRDRNGEPIQYEPGGRFVHTAIQFDDIGHRWLNAYPGEGVAIISQQELETRGTIVEIVEIPQDLTLEQVQPYFGRSFDFWYSWSDDAIYCTELIGKLLEIPTQPMKFNREVWPKNYWHLDGTPGLSPDQLWRWAKLQAK